MHAATLDRVKEQVLLVPLLIQRAEKYSTCRIFKYAQNTKKKYKHTVPGITPQTFGKHGDLCHGRSGTATTQLNCQLPCDVDPSICRPIKGLTDILTTRYSKLSYTQLFNVT